MPKDYKYTVKITPVEKAFRVPKDIQYKLKGVAGGKKLARMKKEGVDCPVLKKMAAFPICFVCDNFQRRFIGEVHCIGNPLT